MIRIFTLSVPEFRKSCPGPASEQVEIACTGLGSTTSAPPISDLELSYDDIKPEEIVLVFGHEQINEANGAFGLPNLLSTVRPAENSPWSGLLFFPLSRFESYLRENFKAVSTEYETAGNMDRYAETKIESMTAIEYLVGGLFELIRHCQQYGRILAIQW